MSRSNPTPYQDKPSRPKTPRPEPGLKVSSVDLIATMRRLKEEGRKVLGMKVKREGTQVHYYLDVL